VLEAERRGVAGGDEVRQRCDAAGISRRELGDRTDGRGPHGGDIRERRRQLRNAQS
jgi:hypothetical protein